MHLAPHSIRPPDENESGAEIRFCATRPDRLELELVRRTRADAPSNVLSLTTPLKQLKLCEGVLEEFHLLPRMGLSFAASILRLLVSVTTRRVRVLRTTG